MKFHSFPVVSDRGVVDNVYNEMWVNFKGDSQAVQIVSTFQGVRPASLDCKVYAYSRESDHTSADIEQQRPDDLFRLGKVLL